MYVIFFIILCSFESLFSFFICSGNFAVDENGYITAKAGGSIANFNIGNYTLSKNTVGLSSNSNYGYAF